MISTTSEWKQLEEVALRMKKTHLGDLLEDKQRNESLIKLSTAGVTLDLSREKLDGSVMHAFENLFNKIDLNGRIDAMFRGDKINRTENRSVLHTALRRPAGDAFKLAVDGMDIEKSVHVSNSLYNQLF